jgi:hypothetical protein
LWYDGFGIDDAGFDGADSGEKTSGILAAVIELDLAKGVESSAFLQGLSTLVENGGGVIVNTMLKSDGARAMEGLLKGVFSEVLAWDGMKGNAVFLCKMGGNA